MAGISALQHPLTGQIPDVGQIVDSFLTGTYHHKIPLKQFSVMGMAQIFESFFHFDQKTVFFFRQDIITVMKTDVFKRSQL